ncbi:MAG: hypothetical protein PVI30_19725 [Myxococcales bacterium]|jgi:hypothetical protein
MARRRLVAAVLGSNLWLTGVAWPWLQGQPPGVAGWLALLPLVAGLSISPSRGDWGRGLLLLVLYPAAIALAVGLLPERVLHRAMGPLAMSVLVVALCAHGVAACAWAGAGEQPLPAERRPLGEPAVQPRPAYQRLMRRGLIGLVLTGAFAVGVVAPTSSEPQSLRRAWGPAVREGGVLTAVVGAAIAVTLVAVLLGSHLKVAPPARPTTRADHGMRVATRLFLALLGVVTYYVIR